MGKDHVVPLSDRAIDIVRELLPLRRKDGSVFPATRVPGPIGTPQLLRLLARSATMPRRTALGALSGTGAAMKPTSPAKWRKRAAHAVGDATEAHIDAATL